jgi:hypothetical protein
MLVLTILSYSYIVLRIVYDHFAVYGSFALTGQIWDITRALDKSHTKLAMPLYVFSVMRGSVP